MTVMSDGSSFAAGKAALEAGRWVEASGRVRGRAGRARVGGGGGGLGAAMWWLGESAAGVTHGSRAYALFRRDGDLAGAVQAAVWLGITYKADFANFRQRTGGLGRTERLLGGTAPGALHGWVRVARAYRMADLDLAAALTGEAAELARAPGTRTSSSPRWRSSG
jgi:hypothetical protein